MADEMTIAKWWRDEGLRANGVGDDEMFTAKQAGTYADQYRSKYGMPQGKKRKDLIEELYETQAEDIFKMYPDKPFDELRHIFESEAEPAAPILGQDDEDAGGKDSGGEDPDKKKKRQEQEAQGAQQGQTAQAAQSSQKWADGADAYKRLMNHDFENEFELAHLLTAISESMAEDNARMKNACSLSKYMLSSSMATNSMKRTARRFEKLNKKNAKLTAEIAELRSKAEEIAKNEIKSKTESEIDEEKPEKDKGKAKEKGAKPVKPVVFAGMVSVFTAMGRGIGNIGRALKEKIESRKMQKQAANEEIVEKWKAMCCGDKMLEDMVEGMSPKALLKYEKNGMLLMMATQARMIRSCADAYGGVQPETVPEPYDPDNDPNYDPYDMGNDDDLDERAIEASPDTGNDAAEKSPAEESEKKSPAEESEKKSPAEESEKKSPAEESEKKSPAEESEKKSPAEESEKKSPAENIKTDTAPTSTADVNNGVQEELEKMNKNAAGNDSTARENTARDDLKNAFDALNDEPDNENDNGGLGM